jgi:GTPase SAR1 family protein
MGAACSGGAEAGTEEEKDRSRKIEQQLKKDKKLLDHEIKLLLLGAGESGKSTIAKQMKIIYLKGFQDAERRPYKEIIFSNIIMSMRALVLAVERLGLEVSPENKDRARLFKSNTILFEQNVTDEIADAVKMLWNDQAVKNAYFNSSEFQLNDSASYFFDSMDRITSPDYLPNDQDILRSRARTTGITEITFGVQDVQFRMVDVGGQRSERKKWIHCFQEVTGLIFCVAMSEYDLKLYEDETVNRMHESIMLFDEICNCQWFNDTAVILFLNKSDLFKEKIKSVDLNVCFPDYTGGCDYTKAAQYISEKFAGLNRNPDKQIFAHITCATDTDNIRFVFNAVREIVLRQSLMKSGVM